MLPFANLSDEAEQAYFSDAITTDIVTNLSKHRWLDVIARNAMLGHDGKPVDARQLARELGIAYVVEGSVRRAGSRIRVTAQLHDAATGINLWSDRYDRSLEDAFAVQDEITSMIAARVEPEIWLAERQRVLRAGSREAIEGFQRAIDLSPNDPQRWAFLTYGALALIFMGDYEGAVTWADRASLIPNCQYWATAHKSVALALLERRDEARKTVDRLLEEKLEFSRMFARKKLFCLKRPEQVRLYLDGLEEVGVPGR